MATSRGETHPTAVLTTVQLIRLVAFSYYFHIRRRRSEGTWKTMPLNQMNLFIGYFRSETQYFKAFNVYTALGQPQPGPTSLLVSLSPRSAAFVGRHLVLFSLSVEQGDLKPARGCETVKGLN